MKKRSSLPRVRLAKVQEDSNEAAGIAVVALLITFRRGQLASDAVVEA